MGILHNTRMGTNAAGRDEMSEYWQALNLCALLNLLALLVSTNADVCAINIVLIICSRYVAVSPTLRR